MLVSKPPWDEEFSRCIEVKRIIQIFQVSDVEVNIDWLSEECDTIPVQDEKIW